VTRLTRPEPLIRAQGYVQTTDPGATSASVVPAPDPIDAPLDLDSFKFRKDGTVTAYVSAQTDPEARNELQDILITRSDVACAAFEDALYRRIAARKFVLTTTALVTSTAAAIVGGETARSVLAGIAATSVGVDAIIDSEFLQNQLVTLVNRQITSQRKDILDHIKSRRGPQNSESTTDYSAGEAVRDVERYHLACSFVAAIDELTKNVSKRNTKEPLIAEKQRLEAEFADINTKLKDNTYDPDLKEKQKKYAQNLQRRISELQRRIELID
jgi:hypothetical protein